MSKKFSPIFRCTWCTATPEDNPAIPRRRLRPTWRLEIDEEETGTKAEVPGSFLGVDVGKNTLGEYWNEFHEFHGRFILGVEDIL
jgi:hypothetical protein